MAGIHRPGCGGARFLDAEFGVESASRCLSTFRGLTRLEDLGDSRFVLPLLSHDRQLAFAVVRPSSRYFRLLVRNPWRGQQIHWVPALPIYCSELVVVGKRRRSRRFRSCLARLRFSSHCSMGAAAPSFVIGLRRQCYPTQFLRLRGSPTDLARGFTGAGNARDVRAPRARFALTAHWSGGRYSARSFSSITIRLVDVITAAGLPCRAHVFGFCKPGHDNNRTCSPASRLRRRQVRTVHALHHGVPASTISGYLSTIRIAGAVIATITVMPAPSSASVRQPQRLGESSTYHATRVLGIMIIAVQGPSGCQY